MSTALPSTMPLAVEQCDALALTSSSCPPRVVNAVSNATVSELGGRRASAGARVIRHGSAALDARLTPLLRRPQR